MELNAGFLIHNNVGRCVCNIWMCLTKLKTAGVFASADFLYLFTLRTFFLPVLKYVFRLLERII